MGTKNKNETSFQQQPETKPKSNTALIVVIVALVMIIVLGAGGYLIWRYVAKRFLEKAKFSLSSVEMPVVSSSLPDTSSESAKISAKTETLENLFKYPRCETFETDHNDLEKTTIKMITLDGVRAVYDYYNNLIAVNSWEEGSRGMATDQSGAWTKVEEEDFRADVNVNRENNKTIIKVLIYFESEDMSFSRVKPEMPLKPETPSVSKPSSGSDWKINVKTESGFVIPGSDTRIISESELYHLTPWELKVARNEIYARHGREFVHHDMVCYFAKQSWYRINPNFKESDLSRIENKNVAIILNYEEEIKSPYLRHDSGCHY